MKKIRSEYVPRIPDLGYEPEDDDTVQAKVGERLERAISSSLEHRTFMRVQLSEGFARRTRMHIELGRVSLSGPIYDIEACWIVLARALEFDERARPELTLRNPNILGEDAA